MRFGHALVLRRGLFWRPQTRVLARLSCTSAAPRGPGRVALPMRITRPVCLFRASYGTSSPSERENVFTLPNLLTVSRMVATPGIAYAFTHHAYGWALGLFVYAGVTDMLDGWIARRYNASSVAGTVLDPMADKLLMVTLTVTLAATEALPVWLASLIIGRDVGLSLWALWYRWISLPPPRTFRRYWDPALPSAEVHPTNISKLNTFLQLVLVGVHIAQPVMALDVVDACLPGLQYTVAATTVASGLSYVFSRNAVRILSKR